MNIFRKIIVLSSLIILVAVLKMSVFSRSDKPHIPEEMPFEVRIRIVKDASEIQISSEASCRIFCVGKDITFNDGITAAKVNISGNGVRIGKDVFPGRSVNIKGESFLKVDGIVYRGSIEIINKGKRMDAVNKVQLEDYLKGVLPRESPDYWPIEALKAQAVASRSFAINEALRRKSRMYDMTADTFSQVYGGMSSERERTNRAVDETRGKVLEFDGAVLPGYFHSCCGGHTEDISVLWERVFEPMRGVKCPWCRISPFFRWKTKIRTQDILSNLKDKGIPIDRIDDIRLKDMSVSGRPEYVSVKSRGRWFDIKTRDFRGYIGRGTLKSAKFNIKKYPRFYLFRGYGWGHGVGMCQWGVLGLSLRRWKFERILKFYYPGARIKDMRTILSYA